jgi:hypothetical protein
MRDSRGSLSYTPENIDNRHVSSASPSYWWTVLPVDWKGDVRTLGRFNSRLNEKALDVRIGSLATEPSRASAEQCPLCATRRHRTLGLK